MARWFAQIIAQISFTYRYTYRTTAPKVESRSEPESVEVAERREDKPEVTAEDPTESKATSEDNEVYQKKDVNSYYYRFY